MSTTERTIIAFATASSSHALPTLRTTFFDLKQPSSIAGTRLKYTFQDEDEFDRFVEWYGNPLTWHSKELPLKITLRGGKPVKIVSPFVAIAEATTARMILGTQ